MPVRRTVLCCLLTLTGAVTAMIEKRSSDERVATNDITELDASLTGTNATNDRIPGWGPEYRLGRVLPSPGFLRDGGHNYFPKGTDFPLSEELNAQPAAEAEKAANLAR